MQNPPFKLLHNKSVHCVWPLSVISCVTGLVIAGADSGPLTLIGAVLSLMFVVVVYFHPSISLFVFLLIWPSYTVLNRFSSLGNEPVLRLWQEALVLLSAMGIVSRIVVQRTRIAGFMYLDRTILLLLLMSIYGSLLSPSLDLILYGFHLTYTPILMYFLVRFLPLKVVHVQAWIRALVAICLLLALIGLYFQFTDPAAYYRLVYGPDELNVVTRRGMFRMGSILANPLYFGILMSIAALLSLVPFGNFQSKWYRLAMFLAFTSCTILSFTRGAVISLLGGVLVMLICYFWSHQTRRYMLLLLTPLLAGLSVFLLSGPAKSDILTYFSDSQGFGLASRISQWQLAWDAITQAPLGHGLGVGHASLRAGEISVPIYDGWYLKVLAEGGIIGLVVFLVFMIGTLLFLMSRIRSTRGTDNVHWFYSGVLAVFVGYSLAAVGSNVWDYYMTSSVVWILIGFAVTVADGARISSLAHWCTKAGSR